VPSWISRSIRFKLIAVVVTAVVAAVALAALAAAWREADRRFVSTTTEMRGIASAFAGVVSRPLASTDVRGVAENLRGIRNVPRIKYVRVVDSNEDAVFQFGAGIVVVREADASALRGDIGLWRAAYLGTYPITVPVQAGGRTIGRLEMVADLSDLQAALFESLLAALVLGGVAVIFGVLASLRLQRSITEPIANLKMAIRDVQATHDFDRVVERTSSDEVGELVAAFNDMLGQIRKRDEALTRHQAHLEDQVDRRTQELKAATVAAEQANQAKSDFLATMSHEIRTPMNGMLVMAELLAAAGLPGRQRRQAEVIVKSGRSLLAIINDILDFSKIEAGKLDLESVPVDPAGLVDDVLQLFAEKANEKGLDLAAYVAPDVPAEVAADPVRLTQVLSNLVNNALKFTECGGVIIAVTWDRRRQLFDVEVADTGVGIAEHKQHSIFDVFAQADQSTTRKYGGTGIGLAICQRLVHAMGGKLTVESTVGKGSSFRFSLPLPALKEAVPLPVSDAGSRPLVWLGLSRPLTCSVLRRALDASGIDSVDVFGRGYPLDEGNVPSALLADVAFLRNAVLPEWVFSYRKGGMTAVGVVADSRDAAADRLVQIGDADFTVDVPMRSQDMRTLVGALYSGADVIVTSFEQHDDRRSGPMASFLGARVLAADDSVLNQEVLVETLRRLDVDVVCVDNGAEAVEAVRSGGFDLVFMDASMPVMDGFAATREIRAWETRERRPETPIVGLSAHAIGEKSRAWREAGMSDYISKPFTLVQIESCLNRWLGGQRIDREMDPDAPRDAATSDNRVVAGEVAGEALILDRAVLDDIAGIQGPGNNLVDRIVALYRQHAPVAAGKLRALVGVKDQQALASAAHALKSMSRNVGAVEVASLCGRLEDEALAGRGTVSAEDVDRIDRALASALSELQATAAEMRNSFAQDLPVKAQRQAG
jgi:signal transduction histidine kinase/DNA-binding NarL/FixJ family response regulator/HPt (histidine-containing phosphotransfer) domain-containing protein